MDFFQLRLFLEEGDTVTDKDFCSNYLFCGTANASCGAITFVPTTCVLLTIVGHQCTTWCPNLIKYLRKSKSFNFWQM